MMRIEKLTKKYWEEIAQIYQDGIATKNATFRTEVPTWEDFDASHCQHSRFIAIKNENIIGWCAITPVSKRYEYRGVAEVSVYVSLSFIGKGIGDILLRELIKSSEENGIWTLYSSLFPENKASVHLHLKNNFRLIGIREKIAQQDGVWRDTVLYERRSKKF